MWRHPVGLQSGGAVVAMFSQSLTANGALIQVQLKQSRLGEFSREVIVDDVNADRSGALLGVSVAFHEIVH